MEIIEKAKEFQKNIYFIAYAKVFEKKTLKKKLFLFFK